MKKNNWFAYALITTILWGVWGALTEIPEKYGFPATLGYSVWALTMVPCALIALKINHWKFEYDIKSILRGMSIGLLGAGGTVILFQALKNGPAYLIFPIISLSPVVTIILSIVFLKEKASPKSWAGIFMALLAIPLLTYQPGKDLSQNYFWLIEALLIFLMWGVQAFIIKVANDHMKAESIFFYMMLSAILLIPFAISATDFKQNINWGFKGPWLTAIIQILNAIGALILVYAFRYGKAIIVSPLTNAGAPVITIIISLLIYSVMPHPVIITGMLLAIFSIFMMGIEEEKIDTVIESAHQEKPLPDIS
jgi:drug/metabolite transporter (DMT)-like permease